MSYEIEKNIPMPTGENGWGFSAAVRSLQLTDSVLSDKSENTTRATVSKISRLTGSVFVVRKVDGGFRVWRTK